MGLTSACIYIYVTIIMEQNFMIWKKRELRCLIWPAAITTNNLAKRTNITKKKRLKVFFLQFLFVLLFSFVCHHQRRRRRRRRRSHTVTFAFAFYFYQWNFHQKMLKLLLSLQYYKSEYVIKFAFSCNLFVVFRSMYSMRALNAIVVTVET